MKQVLAAVAILALVGAGTGASAQQAAGGVASGMDSIQPSDGDRLALALSQIGMTACGAIVQRAATFLFEDGDAGFTVQPLGPDANRWPTVISMETSHAGQSQTRFSTVIVAPGPTCSGFYEQVIVWPTGCAELSRTVFAGFTVSGVLLRDVQVSELNAGLQLYLTPGPNGGCTSVKRELFR